MQLFRHRNWLNAAIIALSVVFVLLSVEPSVSAATSTYATPRKPYKDTQYALNWAGYVVASSFSTPQPTVTMVNGSWTVQAVQASKKPVYSSQWVGIGGFFDSSLIQTGTESDSASGTTTYNAWYELLPAAETPLPSGYPVSPGDKINAFVFLISVNYWNITINDLTKGWHFSIAVSYASSQKSAEWIEERPSIAGSLTTLANFGTSYFGLDYTSVASTNYANVSGTVSSLGSLTNQQIIMVSNNGRNLAVPSSLTSDGTSFSVTYSGK